MGMMGGMPGAPAAGGQPGMRSRGTAAAPSYAFAVPDLREDRLIPVQNVQQVGSRTFFLRNGRWVDSTLTEEQERNVRRIKRFSDEYFELSRQQGGDAAKVLAMEGDVTVVLDGQAYALD